MSKLTDFELHALYSKAFSDKSAEGIVTACVAALRAIESAVTEPLLQRIAELERQLEEARKDAERYRWLRVNWFTMNATYHDGAVQFYLNRSAWSNQSPDTVDAAIDAAMQKGQS